MGSTVAGSVRGEGSLDVGSLETVGNSVELGGFFPGVVGVLVGFVLIGTGIFGAIVPAATFGDKDEAFPTGGGVGDPVGSGDG